MSGLIGNRVMNGTWGEVWLDSDYVAEADAFQAKVNFTKQDISFCGQLETDTKTTATKGTGSIRMHKVNSRMITKIGDKIKKGIEPRFTLIGKLDDPDAYGAERVVIRNVSFDDLTLMNWEVGVSGKIEAPFTFTTHEFLEEVEPK